MVTSVTAQNETLQVYLQADRDRETDNGTGRQKLTANIRLTGRQTDRQKYRQADRQTDKDAGRQVTARADREVTCLW